MLYVESWHIVIPAILLSPFSLITPGRGQSSITCWVSPQITDHYEVKSPRPYLIQSWAAHPSLCIKINIVNHHQLPTNLHVLYGFMMRCKIWPQMSAELFQECRLFLSMFNNKLRQSAVVNCRKYIADWRTLLQIWCKSSFHKNNMNGDQRMWIWYWRIKMRLSVMQFMGLDVK